MSKHLLAGTKHLLVLFFDGLMTWFYLENEIKRPNSVGTTGLNEVNCCNILLMLYILYTMQV